MYKEYRLNRQSLLEQVVQRDGLTCTFCGLVFESKRDRRLTIDHKVPISKGGNHISIVNMQLLCIDCHRKKDEQQPLSTLGKTTSRDPCEAIPALMFKWLLEGQSFC
jgi:5-methylcytosine-specific restriction endonuclease McrA